MPLVPGICPQCGGKISVDSAQKAAVCNFCGTPFIVQEAIENHNHYTVNQFGEGANVTINEATSKERYLANGETALRIKNYDLALETFGNFTKDYPQEYEAWWGYIRAYTQDLTSFSENLESVQQYYRYVTRLCRDKERGEEMKDAFQTYVLRNAETFAGTQRASMTFVPVRNYFDILKENCADENEFCEKYLSKLNGYLSAYSNVKNGVVRNLLTRKLEESQNSFQYNSNILKTEQKNLSGFTKKKIVKLVTLLAGLGLVFTALISILICTANDSFEGAGVCLLIFGVPAIVCFVVSHKRPAFKYLNGNISRLEASVSGLSKTVAALNSDISNMTRVLNMNTFSYVFNRASRKFGTPLSLACPDEQFIASWLDGFDVYT